MSFGSAENYQDSGDIEVLESGRNVWVKVYSASAINNGKVVALKVAANTTPTPDCAQYVIQAVQTTTDATQIIGVVDNGILGKTGIAAAGYGFVCIQGQVEAFGGEAVAANRTIKVLAGEDEFKDGGVASSGDVPATDCGVAIDTLADTTLGTVFLLGRLTTAA